MLILAPILFPIAMKLGIDPVHFGIIMVVNMEVGMPPASRLESVRGVGHHQDGYYGTNRGRVALVADHAGLPSAGDLLAHALSLWMPRAMGMIG